MSTSESSFTRLISRMAYQSIGKLFENNLERYESLRRDLRRAGMDISLRMYLSMSVFLASVFAVGVLIIMVLLALATGIVPLTFVLIAPIITWFSVYIFRLTWPSSKIGERRRNLEASLPSTAAYMAAMSSSGVTPDQIFFSLASDEIGLFTSTDAKKITRDIQIFGLDIIRALESAAARSPSPKYSSFIEGINATNTSGGDLQSYFENASRTLMRDKLADEKAYIDLLGLFAELFLVACIVTPVFGIILVAMVALQGGMEHTDLVLIVLLIVGLIPFFQMVIVILIDGSQPRD